MDIQKVRQEVAKAQKTLSIELGSVMADVITDVVKEATGKAPAPKRRLPDPVKVVQATVLILQHSDGFSATLDSGKRIHRGRRRDLVRQLKKLGYARFLQ